MAAQDSSWAGWIAFAGIVLLIIGVMDILQGFTAIIKDDYVVATPHGLATFDATGWGWTTLIWGILIIITGLGLLAGSDWARWVAIIAVSLANLCFIAAWRASTSWSLVIVAIAGSTTTAGVS